MCFDASASFRHAAWGLEQRPMSGHPFPDSEPATATRPRPRGSAGVAEAVVGSAATSARS